VTHPSACFAEELVTPALRPAREWKALKSSARRSIVACRPPTAKSRDCCTSPTHPASASGGAAPLLPLQLLGRVQVHGADDSHVTLIADREVSMRAWNALAWPPSRRVCSWCTQAATARAGPPLNAPAVCHSNATDWTGHTLEVNIRPYDKSLRRAYSRKRLKRKSPTSC
jgi:hypothetical protein